LESLLTLRTNREMTVASTEETKSMDNLTIDDNDPEMSLEERMNWLRERVGQLRHTVIVTVL
jgi:hypothetical protein